MHIFFSSCLLFFLRNVISFLFFFLVISRSEILEEKKVADCLKILEEKIRRLEEKKKAKRFIAILAPRPNTSYILSLRNSTLNST